MKKILAGLLVASSVFVCGSVKADVHAKGADGPAADPAIKEGFLLDFGSVLAANVDYETFDCGDSDEANAKLILVIPANKKLIAAAKNKNVTPFLKQLGLGGSAANLFKEAALGAAASVCNFDEEDPEDPEGPEDEF